MKREDENAAKRKSVSEFSAILREADSAIKKEKEKVRELQDFVDSHTQDLQKDPKYKDLCIMEEKSHDDCKQQQIKIEELEKQLAFEREILQGKEDCVKKFAISKQSYESAAYREASLNLTAAKKQLRDVKVACHSRFIAAKRYLVSQHGYDDNIGQQTILSILEKNKREVSQLNRKEEYWIKKVNATMEELKHVQLDLASKSFQSLTVVKTPMTKATGGNEKSYKIPLFQHKKATIPPPQPQVLKNPSSFRNDDAEKKKKTKTNRTPKLSKSQISFMKQRLIMLRQDRLAKKQNSLLNCKSSTSGRPISSCPDYPPTTSLYGNMVVVNSPKRNPSPPSTPAPSPPPLPSYILRPWEKSKKTTTTIYGNILQTTKARNCLKQTTLRFNSANKKGGLMINYDDLLEDGTRKPKEGERSPNTQKQLEIAYLKKVKEYERAPFLRIAAWVEKNKEGTTSKDSGRGRTIAGKAGV